MAATLMSPWMIRKLLQRPDAIVAAGKVVMTEHEQNTALGGVLLNPAVKFKNNGGWEMHAGVFVFLPDRSFISDKDTDPGVWGWEMSDILSGGLDHERYWTEALAGGEGK